MIHKVPDPFFQKLSAIAGKIGPEISDAIARIPSDPAAIPNIR